jgi:surface antigen
MTILHANQVTSIASQAGFSGGDLQIAVAIAFAESSFDTAATNSDNNGSKDYGLWQINSTHGYDSALLLSSPQYNANAAFRIYTQSGRNFTAWTTYNSGAYRQYLNLATVKTNGVTQSVKSGTSNGYPKGQCTWWADERYHQLTGYYVPWSANAKDWLFAATANGWNVSSTPHVPSILVLQPGTQGSDPTFGHVAIVEKVNADGSVYTSAQNVTGVQLVNGVAYLNYKPGNGVSFVWAGSNTQPQNGVPGTGGTATLAMKSDGSNYTPILQQVHNTLVEVPGFYGIALALDEAETYPGWIDLTNKDNGPLGWITGNQFDFVGLTRSIGASIAGNSIPFAIRTFFLLLGGFILVMLILRVVSGATQSGMSVASELAPLAAL